MITINGCPIRRFDDRPKPAECFTHERLLDLIENAAAIAVEWRRAFEPKSRVEIYGELVSKQEIADMADNLVAEIGWAIDRLREQGSPARNS